MPSKASSRSHSNNNNQYNLVQSDDLDTRIPLMPDEAFQQGIPFNCKFIGSMDIPRPTSRVEIVAAMRRVRFEFKQKGIKKKKVTVTVSINGIKTTLRKRRSKKRRFKSSKDYMDVESSMLIESHPIYRIFYVSHDSQDVKIFSYIARETSSNVFHCCVFKANKKAQAMRIVRTVGQAFEVCHKLVGHPDDDFDVPINEEETLKKVLQELPEHKRPTAAARAHKLFSKLSRRTSDIAENSEHNPKNNNQKISHEINQKIPQELPKVEPQKLEEKTEIIQKPRPSDLNLKHEEVDLVNLSTPATPTITKTKQITPPINQSPVAKHKMQFFGSTNEIGSSGSNILSGSGSMAAIHEAQLVKEKLEQQQQQTQAALAQINLLRDQLAAESAARIEAQSRTHQLLLHNKELLDHLQSLVRHIQELEGKISNNPISLSSTNSPAPPLPQVSGSVYYNKVSAPSVLSFQEIETLRRQNSALLETILYEQNARNFFQNYSPSNTSTRPFFSFYNPSLVLNNQMDLCNVPQNYNQFYQLNQNYNKNKEEGEKYGTVFNCQGDALEIIKPLGLAPPQSLKLGQIGRNASADEARDEFNTHDANNSLKRQILLGRSVSEKIGHKSELMSQVQRTTWQRHTTK